MQQMSWLTIPRSSFGVQQSAVAVHGVSWLRGRRSLCGRCRGKLPDGLLIASGGLRLGLGRSFPGFLGRRLGSGCAVDCHFLFVLLVLLYHKSIDRMWLDLSYNRSRN